MCDSPDCELKDRPFSLASFTKNNSQNTSKIDLPKWCPHSKFYGDCILDFENGFQDFKRYRLGCNQWGCPVCSVKKAKVLRIKCERTLKAWIDENCPKGFRHGYQVKFLTLTVPGEHYRRTFDPDIAEVHIKKNLDRLIKALRADVGWFEYFWVNELQQDGFPHIHIMLLGKNIAPFNIYEKINKLWWKKYRMGFTFIKAIKGGAADIAYYMTKYISKECGAGRKGNRVYSMSKGLKKNFKTDRKVKVTLVEFGRIIQNPDGTETFQKIWDQEGVALSNNFEELMNFFGDMANLKDEVECDLMRQVELKFQNDNLNIKF